MTRMTAGAANSRAIIDLSWLPGTSVNAGVDINTYTDVEYIVEFPTIDTITNRVLALTVSLQKFISLGPSDLQITLGRHMLLHGCPDPIWVQVIQSGTSWVKSMVTR